MIASRLLLLLAIAVAVGTTRALNPFKAPWSLQRRPHSLDNIKLALRPGKDLEPYYTADRARKVQFGSFLVDASRSFDPQTLASTRLPWWVLLWSVKRTAKKEFPRLVDSARVFKITRESVGVFRPEEHLLSPEGWDGAKARKIDKKFRVSPTENELDISPYSGMAKYITLSRQFVQLRLQQAFDLFQKDKADEALVSMGRAFHAVDDWFANTNYLNLMLIYANDKPDTSLLPGVGDYALVDVKDPKFDEDEEQEEEDDGDDIIATVYPLVSGRFGDLDRHIYSLQVAKEQLQHALERLPHQTPTKRGVIGQFFHGFKERRYDTQLNKIEAQLLKLERQQAEQVRDNSHTNPHYSLLTKKYYADPMNDLANRCSQLTIRSLANTMTRAVSGMQPVEELMYKVEDLFSHPGLYKEAARPCLGVFKGFKDAKQKLIIESLTSTYFWKRFSDLQ